jgi:hypothetical protein
MASTSGAIVSSGLSATMMNYQNASIGQSLGAGDQSPRRPISQVSSMTSDDTFIVLPATAMDKSVAGSFGVCRRMLFRPVELEDD